MKVVCQELNFVHPVSPFRNPSYTHASVISHGHNVDRLPGLWNMTKLGGGGGVKARRKLRIRDKNVALVNITTSCCNILTEGAHRPIKVKVKYPCVVFQPITTPWRSIGEWRYISMHSLTSALDGGEWSASRPDRFTPRKRAPGTHWIGGFYM
jgi:hypothetical protein